MMMWCLVLARQDLFGLTAIYHQVICLLPGAPWRLPWQILWRTLFLDVFLDVFLDGFIDGFLDSCHDRLLDGWFNGFLDDCLDDFLGSFLDGCLNSCPSTGKRKECRHGCRQPTSDVCYGRDSAYFSWGALDLPQEDIFSETLEA